MLSCGCVWQFMAGGLYPAPHPNKLAIKPRIACYPPFALANHPFLVYGRVKHPTPPKRRVSWIYEILLLLPTLTTAKPL